MSNIVDRVLDQLSNVKKNSQGWTARCPAHEDRRNSLSLGVGDDARVLIHCHAGCALVDILGAIGLSAADLFPDSSSERVFVPSHNGATAQRPPKNGAGNGQNHCAGVAQGLTLASYCKAKRLPVDFLKGLGVSQFKYQDRPAVRIPYLSVDGEVVAARYRVALTGDRFRWKVGAKPCLYGLWRLTEFADDHITLVEGESDAQTFWRAGVPAVGLPGAANWRERRDAEHLKRFATIYVVVEPDQGGEATKKWLAASSIRERVKLIDLGKHKDASGLYLANPDGFLGSWQAATIAAIPWSDYEAATASTQRAEAWDACRDLARQPDILSTFFDDLVKVGVVGERQSAALIFLATTTRLLDKVVSAVVKGPSSAGKSFVCARVLRFFPEDAFYTLTAMSERALAYSEEPIMHRMLVIYEAAALNNDFASYLLRSLLSEGCLRYELVEKTKEGLRPRLIERSGPTGLLITTTAIALHPENETRLLSLPVSDTAEQTSAVFRVLADESRPELDMTRWHAFQNWLATGPTTVTIPFAGDMARLTANRAVRLRRDFSAVLSLIRAHALLHQATRDKDEHGRIVATIRDYEAVVSLVADIIAESVESSVPKGIRETVAAVEEVIASGKEEASLVDLMKVLKLDRSTVSRRVRAAVARGYLKNLEERKGKAARLCKGDATPDNQAILPDSDALLHPCMPDGGINHTPSPGEDDGDDGDEDPSSDSSSWER